MSYSVIIVAMIGAAITAIGAIQLIKERQEAALSAVLAIDRDSAVAPAASGFDAWQQVFGRTTPRQGHTGIRLAPLLEQARIPIRVGEARMALALFSLSLVGLVLVGTGNVVLSVAAAGLLPAGAVLGLRRTVKRRRSQIVEAMPEALALMATSLRAGHTMHRAIESYASTGDDVLSEEFHQVLVEIQLGATVVEALSSMSERIPLSEIKWLARTVAIQYRVGGRLAELLDVLSAIAYARNELNREVSALTAEGRASAWMLGALPPLLMGAMYMTNPEYLHPLFSGTGLLILIGCAVSVVTGVAVIWSMVTKAVA